MGLFQWNLFWGVVWAAVGAVVTYYAYERKDRNPSMGALIGGVIGGLFALIPGLLIWWLILWLAVPHLGKSCPYCAEKIRRDARVCRHCGRDVRTGSTGSIELSIGGQQQPAAIPGRVRSRSEAMRTPAVASARTVTRPSNAARFGERDYAALPSPFGWVAISAGQVEIDERGTLDVAAFELAQYPVTHAQYALFVESGGYSQPEWWDDDGWALLEMHEWYTPFAWDVVRYAADDQPVVGVSWHEATAFCRWLGAQLSDEIMLPSEEQWLRAAQGDDGRAFPWGDDVPDGERCNFRRSAGKPTAVNHYPAGASPFGVMDMAGNVWEWCSTQYIVLGVEQKTPFRVLRGGAWSSMKDDDLRVTYRNRRRQRDRANDVGFRIARMV